jgi:hypothetical protein
MLATWVTVVSGVVVLGVWSPGAERGNRLTAMASTHIAAAAVGVALWTIFGISRSQTLGALALAVLGTTAVLGTATLIASLRQAAHTPPRRALRVPAVIVAIHGALAVLTIVAAVVAWQAV